MCECGCYGNAGIYRIKAPKGWYRIILSPPCNNCDVGGSITIEHDASVDYNPDFDEPLPLEPVRNSCTFICSNSETEIKKAAVAAIEGSEVDGGIVDDIQAELFGEELALHLPKYPSIAGCETIGKE
jgi:hypothetical protein